MPLAARHGGLLPVQSLGTLFFNVTTFRGLQVTLTDPHYDKLVWRPDAYGSICFLVSGVLAYRVSARHGWLPLRAGLGWWQPGVNLLGCVFLGVCFCSGRPGVTPSEWSR
jgi:hypothetical protein